MARVAHDIRQRDGARKQCSDHPDADLEQGFTLSGQLKTWCTAPGCPNLAQWVPQTDVRGDSREPGGDA